MATDPTTPPVNDPSSGLPDDIHDADAAADLIRQKVARVYAEEPDASAELAEAEAEEVQGRSPHQQFMYELGTSGKDLAAIQTEWHDYYQNLPPRAKHQVWQEFYASQSAASHLPPSGPDNAEAAAQELAKHKHQAAKPNAKSKKLRDSRSASDVRAAIRDQVTAGGKLRAKHHLQSLLFGLGMGAIVLIIFLFGFFNEVVIAPFVQPGRTSASTPLIVNSDSVAPTANPEVIIPKINVEIPVVYGQTSIDEAQIENALESGVVHYPTTSLPGQNGNAAFFGHSSNNIFNGGKYKFAFVLLHTLEPGDTFYLTYNGKVYAYKVITKTVVDPSNVGVLNPVAGQTATATLITCDPPGTSLRRLVVVGQQISPEPSGNTASAAAATTLPANDASPSLPGNGPTLWGRLTKPILGKAVVFVVVGAAILFAARRLNQRFSHLLK